MIGRASELRQRKAGRNSRSKATLPRPRRVGAEHVFELARHLTERDRELALCLYDQQVLTTDQLELLFFSSRRRAQDRLLFLYRNRMLDRFYPATRFGSGKPQAHWLLDEAGALLVAATLDLERKQLPWQRREDWRSHPQLAHRIEANRFVTDLVAATLPEKALGVAAWYGPREAAARLGERMHGALRPDAELILQTPTGPIDLLLEWDRGTETQERLEEKLRRYRYAERDLRYADPEQRNVLFVFPGARRIEPLRHALSEINVEERERVHRDRWAIPFEPRWPILAASASELHRRGPLAPLWQRLDIDELPCALVALPVRSDLADLDPGLALGRRWRHERPDFWERLSPLGRDPSVQRVLPDESSTASAEAKVPDERNLAHEAGDASSATASRQASDAETKAYLERLRLLREAERAELGRELPVVRTGRRMSASGDLRPSFVDGSMADPETKEGLWR